MGAMIFSIPESSIWRRASFSRVMQCFAEGLYLFFGECSEFLSHVTSLECASIARAYTNASHVLTESMVSSSRKRLLLGEIADPSAKLGLLKSAAPAALP